MPAEVRPALRAHAFKHEGLICKNDSLVCKHCGFKFKSTKLSVVKTHISSKNHIAQSNRITNRELDFGVGKLQEEFVTDLVQSFARSNIPLQKVAIPDLSLFLYGLNRTVYTLQV